MPRLYVYPAILSRFLSGAQQRAHRVSAKHTDATPRVSRSSPRRRAVPRHAAPHPATRLAGGRVVDERGALRFQLHVPFARDRIVSLLLIRTDFDFFFSLFYPFLLRPAQDCLYLHYTFYQTVVILIYYCAFVIDRIYQFRIMIIAIACRGFDPGA